MTTDTAPGAPESSNESAVPPVDPSDVEISFGEAAVDSEDYRTQVFRLMTPRTRAAIVDALLQANDEPITAQNLADQHSGFNVASFNRHRDQLIELGVLIEAGKQGNATTYRLNTNHPAVQLLGMVNQVYTHGSTPLLLNEKFLRDDDL
jgi:predicted transcriptional regulator